MYRIFFWPRNYPLSDFKAQVALRTTNPEPHFLQTLILILPPHTPNPITPLTLNSVPGPHKPEQSLPKIHGYGQKDMFFTYLWVQLTLHKEKRAFAEGEARIRYAKRGSLKTPEHSAKGHRSTHFRRAGRGFWVNVQGVGVLRFFKV